MEYSTERTDAQGRWLPVATQTIEGAQAMPTFFMSVASPSNHWMFLSSLWSLTAGRRSIESALFPYRTVDQIYDATGRVGGRTLVRRVSDGALWEPFSERSAGRKGITRSVKRSVYGTSVTLVERHEDFGLEVRQTWTTSADRGVLRFVKFKCIGTDKVSFDVIDGVVDLLPSCVDPGMQTRFSSLVEAYRMAELCGVRPHVMGVFRLGSIPLDRAEPNEALLATTAWSTAEGEVLLSEDQFDAFRRGEQVETEERSRGVRGAFLVARRLALGAAGEDRSAMAFEVDQAADDVERTLGWLASESDALGTLREEAAQTEARLAELLSRADGLQRTASFAEDARHYANTLYNVMRGGLPVGAYDPPELDEAESMDAFRRGLEALPLGLSRRHGDPSRPWNRFDIDIEGEDGSFKVAYQGNWRDIFQNWEALALSYPRLLPGFVARFLNATTADGYNPYRVDSENGIDWEVEDPNDPWSHIGYWGDHQIVYLTRLIERLEERFPGQLQRWLGAPAFVFADVPYRIAGLDALLRDPSNSVSFDEAAAARSEARTEAGLGVDARLLHDEDGALVRATLEEKLLVPTLAKLSNFVPGAGIWMNTQRPEWNDANNALVGLGASVVTTAALYAHVARLKELLAPSASLTLSERTRDLLATVSDALADVVSGSPRSAADAGARWAYVQAAGRAGEVHRAAVYGGQGGEAVSVKGSIVAEFLERAHTALGVTLAASQRSDGLFHAYRLLRFGEDAVEVDDLPLMLEGQAAILGCGFLDGPRSAELLVALRMSPLYRSDLGTYLLYPDRELPSLLDLGCLPQDMAQHDPLVGALLDRGREEIVRMSRGSGTTARLRFGPGMHTVAYLRSALSALPDELQGLVREHGGRIEAAYEASFQHASFLGRSGSFFGYEGLGCTYWHMVSKLALAVQESALRAADAGDEDAASTLLTHYREVRAGIGANKTPAEYGAFPSEPYSHSPSDGRVRQPGMTGQVKEDLLARLAEAGLRVRGGQLTFDSSCVAPGEFLEEPAPLPRPPEADHRAPVQVPAGAFAITHCGVPMVIHRGETLPGASVRGQVRLSSGEVRDFDPSEGLEAGLSQEVFRRTGVVTRVDVAL
ncbi:MAG: hypothetical protein AAGG01_04950 [Planctomycetota bacterium]